jgi:hypothetical protein
MNSETIRRRIGDPFHGGHHYDEGAGGKSSPTAAFRVQRHSPCRDAQALPDELITDRLVRHDNTDRIERADMTPPIEKNDPIEKREPDEPTLPIDSTEPTEPTESIDPREPMERTESRDQSDNRELFAVFAMCSTLLEAGPAARVVWHV